MPQRTNTRWKEEKKEIKTFNFSWDHDQLFPCLTAAVGLLYRIYFTRLVFYFIFYFCIIFFPSSVCINIHPRMFLVHLIIREIWREIKKKKRLYTFHNTSSGITFAKSPSQYAMYADIIKYWSKVNVSWAKGT